MPYTNQTSEFYGWYLRHNSRTVWKQLFDAGIDTFASGPSNNPQSFLDLTNVLPAVNGGLNRRWGTSTLRSNSSAGVVVNPVRTFAYNVPQDQSDVVNTATTNLFITTDNQTFSSFNDDGTPFSGYGPVGFPHAGKVGAVVSRGWFYVGNGQDAPSKVNPSYTTANTSSLVGIAIPSSSPGSQNYSDYPCVIIPSGPSGSIVLGSVGMTAPGAGYAVGQILTPTGGTGSGLRIQVDTVWTNPYGGPVNAIGAYHVHDWGTGYTQYDVLTDVSGTPARWTVTQVPTNSLGGSGSGGSGLGYATNTSFTVGVNDIPGGAGTGAQITCYTDSVGAVVKAVVSVVGSGYTQGWVSLPAPLAGGTQGYVTVYTQTNKNLTSTYGQIQGADLAGPMTFVQGRQWVVALQNSKTGHTSDVFVTQVPVGPVSGTEFNILTTGYTHTIDAIDGTIPIYISSQDQSAGFTQVNLTIQIPSAGLDPQVDTAILLASADGQGLGTLYEVNKYPLSGFVLHSGFYVKQVYDTIPDSLNSTVNTYTVPVTLLNANVWAYTDPAGNSFGILDNTPPTAQGFLYPTLHQGRLFATDGKTIFFSKSLEEVTTATGLITSKWEECWPGDYQLPLALNNESIVGLRSDGSNLHAATERSIYTVYGSDPSSFSVPGIALSETGLLHNDCWSVIYAEGMPIGYVWITPDLRVMHSNYSTYQDIGTGIYPSLQRLDRTKIENCKVLSLSHGPYNFVVLALPTTGIGGNAQPEFWIWESRLKKWYHWLFTYADAGGASPVSTCFTYQPPTYSSSSLTKGSKYLLFWQYVPTSLLQVRYFSPTNTQDGDGSYNIQWNVQTSWQDLGDSTAIKVVNEIELTSDESSLYVSLYGANSQSQFDSGGVLLKAGATVTGPISSLASKKFYCAGAKTASKYYSIQVSTTSPGTSASVLSSFSAEHYPIARI